MFRAETLDDLTLEQYNILIEFENLKYEVGKRSTNKETTSIVTVPGKAGIDYKD